MNNKEKLIAKVLMVILPVSGMVSLFLFVIFLFTGSLSIIDIELSEAGVFAWNGTLSIMFFIQHSLMIRKSFRDIISSFIPSYYNDAIFTLASSIVLTGVVILWLPSETVLYELEGAMRLIARGVYFMGIIGTFWGVRALKSFDSFGLAPIKDHIHKRQPRLQNLSIAGPYLWMRHPLYFFVLLLMWSYPDLSLDRLIFNVLWTIWILIGTVLEEKDLVSVFGDEYRKYQNKVPMLIPWKGRMNSCD